MGVRARSILTLKFDLILDNEGLSLVVDLLGEFGRNSMMSCGVLDNKPLVTFHALEDMGFFYSPFSNVCPFLILVRALGVLLGVRWLPSCLPTICELLDEIGFNGGRLESS